MSIDKILDRYKADTEDLWEHYMEGTDVDPEQYDKMLDNAVTVAKKAIYKDLIELSICVGMTQVSEGKWKKDLAVPADKLKEYCGIE